MSVSASLRRCCGYCGTRHQVFPPFQGKFSRNPFNLVLLQRWSSTSAVGPNSNSSAKSEWQSVIGLEIHAQIKSNSKLFSGAGTKYGASTNSQVAFFDAALPGTLPVLNKRCVEAGVLTSLALGCDINMVSKFDRKHYFYADIPAGYQITQQRKPLAVNGQVTYVFQCSRTSRVERRTARLVQLQLEQDSGKSLHDADQGVSLIDLNRAGMGLMEIVTAPDFTDGDDAASFVRDLRDILMAVETCDGKMAEGSMRVDANISVNRPGEELGTRTEVKNLNSFRSLRLAITYEIERQIHLLEAGGVVENETRSFDLESGETVPMRDKEKLLDYRFMPEPNLPPLVIHKVRPKDVPVASYSDQQHQTLKASSNEVEDVETAAKSNIVVLDELAAQMGELPDQTRQRLETQYEQSLLNSVILVRSGLFSLFETLVQNYQCSPEAASHIVRNSVNSLLDKLGVTWSESPVSEIRIAELTKLYQDGVVSGASLGQLVEEMLRHPEKTVRSIVDKLGLWKTDDASVILEAVDDVFSRNPRVVKAYKKGKTNQLEILVNKVMKQLENKADSKTVHTIIRDRLQS